MQLLEHDHAISCPLNSNLLNILLLGGSGPGGGCGIVHLRRSVNQVAHYLAKASVFGSEMGKWRCSRLIFLDDVLIQDLII